MRKQITRREMLRNSAFAGVAVWAGAGAASARAWPSGKLNVACVGVGGRGHSNVQGMAGENIVALCDVDGKMAEKSYQMLPKVKKYQDFRKMYDEMAKEIDGVVVSTPDHTHFHPALGALQLGKHLYNEKPLMHSVWETRTICNLAREKKVATQLGTQRHALSGMRRVVEVLRSGAIGDVTEVHCWIDSDRGMLPIPKEYPPVPDWLNWDLWIGPAPMMPYSRAYCPYYWKFWWPFGTGETGNWGCHNLDIAFWALDLKLPTRVSAAGPPRDPIRTPTQMKVTFEFPARGAKPPLTLFWHHAKDGPRVIGQKGLSPKNKHGLYIGTKGMLLCGYDHYELHPKKEFEGFEPPAESIPESPGFHQEWIDACKGGKPATCNFEYSGPLAETVMLGNLAYRIGGGPFEYDSANLKAKGFPEADPYIRETYRKGWEVDL